MELQDALQNVIVDYTEDASDIGESRARGHMRLDKVLEGPPNRLHGGHHAVVRTLPILARISEHDARRSFPCGVDVTIERALPLDELVGFEATYEASDDGWRLTTCLLETQRLVAHARSISTDPLLSTAELSRLRGLYERSSPTDNRFKIFGVTVHLADAIVWMHCHDPKRTLPDSQHAALVERSGQLGPSFAATQLDLVAATARGSIMRHPHFTKRIELQFASDRIPAAQHLLCIGDRTTIEEDAASSSSPVEIDGVMYGTARIFAALVDESFEHTYATCHVTAHPVDPGKVEALQKMRELREDI